MLQTFASRTIAMPNVHFFFFLLFTGKLVTHIKRNFTLTSGEYYGYVGLLFKVIAMHVHQSIYEWKTALVTSMKHL